MSVCTDFILYPQHPQDWHGQAVGGTDWPWGLYICPHQRAQEGGGGIQVRRCSGSHHYRQWSRLRIHQGKDWCCIDFSVLVTNLVQSLRTFQSMRCKITKICSEDYMCTIPFIVDTFVGNLTLTHDLTTANCIIGRKSGCINYSYQSSAKCCPI